MSRKQHSEASVTADAVGALLQYDPATGAFTWRVYLGGGAPQAGEPAGSLNKATGYLMVRVLGKSRRAHRLAWLLTHGNWPAHFIDHRNGIRHDNRLVNLREATDAINAQNQRRAQRNNGTGLLGAHWHRCSGRYSASIYVNGRQQHIGLFDTAEAAHAAYIAAKRQLHPGATV